MVNSSLFVTVAGDFIIIDPIEEGDKVRGEIAHVLFKDHVCHIQKEGLW